MVFLIGPSGAGKTTLRHAVMQEVFGNPLYWGTGRIPAIETISMLPNNAYFSSRELAKSLNEQLHVPDLAWLLHNNHSLDPAIKEKLLLDIEDARAVWNQINTSAMTEGDYWRVLPSLTLARCCKFISIDQVTGLLKNRRNTLPADHTFHLMSIAEAAQIMFIMTGVPECTELWSIHHELRRRVIPIWLRPYSAKVKGDHAHFLRLLKTLSQRYKLSRPDLLFLMADDLLAASGGLVGHLVRILDNAQIKAKADGAEHIRKSNICDSFYGQKDLARVWKDVHNFEECSRPACVRKLSAQIQAEREAIRGDTATTEGVDA